VTRGTVALDARIRGLYPGYFALVMATGIVSNAFYMLGGRWLSGALLAVNLAAFPLLVLATLLRAIRHPRALWADLTDARLVFAFFTIVAAADVLGVQLHLRGEDGWAAALWLGALGLWLFLTYFSFAVLTFVKTHAGVDVIHGGWLIAIVGTESLVLLGALLAPNFGPLAGLAYVTVHVLWGVGIAFYGIFITLFSYRIFFLRVEPADLTPLLWVVMGAAAISANAGSTLILSETGLPFLAALRPFVDGVTLCLWAWGTWWIPMLVIFGVWKYWVRRDPLAYHPTLWSVVFPLGMYTVATFKLSLAADFTPLQAVAGVMLWVAFGAWLATLLGLLASLRRPVA
jgi:tellurite resistance protein TehA-like permease